MNDPSVILTADDGIGEGGSGAIGIVPEVVLHLFVSLLVFVGGPGFKKQVPLLLLKEKLPHFPLSALHRSQHAAGDEVLSIAL
jgi:hypothetical protein